jgi:hypothetical protein
MIRDNYQAKTIFYPKYLWRRVCFIIRMKNVIIVSKCLRVDLRTGEYHFHFKGVFAGEAVERVTLVCAAGVSLSSGEEYLLYVQLISCLQGELRGKVIKARRLEECWDKS